MIIRAFSGVIFLILLIEIYSEEPLWSKEEDDCAVELKLDRTVMQALNKQNVTPEHNTDFNNFLGCYWDKKERFTTVGEINWELIDDLLVQEFQKEYREVPELTTVLAEEMVLHAAAECRNDDITGDSHGQKVARLRNCVKNKIHNAIENFEKTATLAHRLFVKLF